MAQQNRLIQMQQLQPTEQQFLHQQQHIHETYNARQRDGQMVIINSNENTVNVSLAQLAPNLQHIQDSLGLSSSDIYYQVQSFRFKNKFYNIQPQYYIQIYASVEWMDIRTGDTFQMSGESEAEPLQIYLSEERDYQTVKTNQEIVTEMQQEINRKVWDLRTSASSPSNYSLDLLHALENTFLSYEEDTGKLAVCLYAGDGNMQPLRAYATTVNDIGNSLYLSNFRINRITLRFHTGATLKYSEQAIIARVLGFVDTYTSYNEVDLSNPQPQDSLGPYFFMEIPYYAVDCEELYYRKTSTTYSSFMRMTPSIKVFYAPEPMVTSLLSAIRIHSSLLSNAWNQYGVKMNVIESIPILGNTQSEDPFNYEPLASSSRVGNIRDSSASLQSFNIYFTDENDASIDFIEPYELKILIFFKQPSQ